MGSQTRQVSSLAPTSLSRSRISSVNLSSYTAVGCSGPGITGSSSCQVSRRLVGLVSDTDTLGPMIDTDQLEFRHVAACIAVVIHLLLGINPSSPIAPPSLVPLGLAGFILPLCTNVFVTALIAARIWLLSPRKVRDMRGVYFPEGTGRTAIDIVIESGALYLIVQLVFVVLFAIRHPAQGIVGVIAVQTYVRNRIAFFWQRLMGLYPRRTGYCASTHHHPRCARTVKYTARKA